VLLIRQRVGALASDNIDYRAVCD